MAPVSNQPYKPHLTIPENLKASGASSSSKKVSPGTTTPTLNKIELPLRPAPTSTPVSTASRSVDLIKESDTAAGESGLFGAAADAGKQVRGLFELGTKIADSGADGKQAIEMVGKSAQKVIRGELSREAATELIKQAGVKPELIPHISTQGLIKSGYDYVASGFDKKVFFNSLESSASDSMKLSGASKAASSTTDASSAATIGGKVVGAVGAAYSAYEVFSNWGKGGTFKDGISSAVSGATAGAYVGSMIFPGLGTVIGGAIGGAIGFIGGMVKAGKNKDQIARDGVRDVLQQAGIIDEKWQLTLADGSKYDVGKDGGFKLTNVDGSTRGAYDVDFKNPLANEVVGMANSLAVIVTGGDPKLTSDYAGYFTNAALSNAKTIDDAKANLQAIFSCFGAEPEQMADSISQLVREKKITAENGQAYINGLSSLLSTNDLDKAA